MTNKLLNIAIIRLQYILTDFHSRFKYFFLQKFTYKDYELYSWLLITVLRSIYKSHLKMALYFVFVQMTYGMIFLCFSSVGHRRPRALPHHHVVVLPRRARHHCRVRLHRPGVIQQCQAVAGGDRALRVRKRQQAAGRQQERSDH